MLRVNGMPWIQRPADTRDYGAMHPHPVMAREWQCLLDQPTPIVAPQGRLQWHHSNSKTAQAVSCNVLLVYGTPTRVTHSFLHGLPTPTAHRILFQALMDKGVAGLLPIVGMILRLVQRRARTPKSRMAFSVV